MPSPTNKFEVVNRGKFKFGRRTKLNHQWELTSVSNCFEISLEASRVAVCVGFSTLRFFVDTKQTFTWVRGQLTYRTCTVEYYTFRCHNSVRFYLNITNIHSEQ
jgi:hypothetical protein